MDLTYDHTQAQLPPQPPASTTILQLGTPVLYDGLPTQVISGPRNMLGIEVVTLAYIGWPVPVDSPDLQIMPTYRAPTEQELQLLQQRVAERKAADKRRK